MKILINATSKNRATNQHLGGLANIAALSNQVNMWYNQYPFLDALSDLGNDDLYIGPESFTTNSLINKKCKKIIILDRENYKIEFEPNLVIEVFVPTDYSKKLIQYPAVDAIHIRGEAKPHFKAELGYVGNLTEEKRKLIHEYIVKYFNNGHRIKIFGSNPWMGWNQYYRGPIPEDQIKDFYASCSVCPHFDTHISSRPYKILAAGSQCVVPNASGLAHLPVIEDTMIDGYMDISITRKERENNIDLISKNHTYQQRWDEIKSCLV